MSDNFDRIYDILRTQGETLARISQSQADTHERLFGGNGVPGAITYLHTEVAKHGRQITFWKGGIAVLTFLWGAALAWGGIVLNRHR